jgi:exonuclease III
MFIEETKVNTHSMEAPNLETQQGLPSIRNKYKWYFSTGVPFKDREQYNKKKSAGLRPSFEEKLKAEEKLGVAIVINREIEHLIMNIEAINGRLQTICLDTTPSISFINTYCPQSGVKPTKPNVPNPENDIEEEGNLPPPPKQRGKSKMQRPTKTHTTHAETSPNPPQKPCEPGEIVTEQATIQAYQIKEEHYRNLQSVLSDHKKKYDITIVVGDLNARIITRETEEEKEFIGNFFIDKGQEELNQMPEIMRDNRDLKHKGV